MVEPWVVHTDDENTTAYEVIWESGIPTVGTLYSSTLTIYQILQGGVTATRVDNNKFQWLVTLTYTATGFSIGGGRIDRLTAFTLKNRTYTRTAESCYDYSLGGVSPSSADTKKYSIQNSAKDPFEPSSVQEEYHHQIISWTQRERSNFDYTRVADFQGTLNEENVTVLGISIDRGKGLLRGVEPVLSTDDFGEFEWRCSYQIEVAEVDHWLTALDAGYYRARRRIQLFEKRQETSYFVRRPTRPDD